MADYAFVTVWHLETDADRIWAALWSTLQWPRWWRWVRSVEELVPAGPDGLGSIRRFHWGSPLGYNLDFTMRSTRGEPPTIIEAMAEGELDGVGRWELTPADGVTVVRYDWHVHTTRTWMNVVAPVARPLFRWNHNRVMADGGEDLARFLGTRLVRGTHELAPR
jgi:hypothetical protein